MIKVNKKDIEKAEYIANNGRVFSEQLKNEIDVFYDLLGETNSYFAITLAISLTWTKHAKDDVDFVKYASDFIDRKISKDEKFVKSSSFRFGYDGLDIALKNYRILLNKVKSDLIDFNNCSVDELTRLQYRLSNKISFLKRDGIITGIGPWLFLGPFKIIINHQKRLWDKPNLNKIVLATGFEVEKGLKRLKHEKYFFMDDLDKSLQIKRSKTLLDNYANCAILHERIKKIAKIANTSTIHINSGLHLYGKKDI